MDKFFEKLSSKHSFILGLVSGFLVLCTIGFFIMLIMFLTGNVGKIVAKGGSNNIPANINQGAQAPADDVAAPSDLAKNLQPISNDDNVRGNKNAEVVLVEFSDFQCPFCSRAHDTLKKIYDDYKGQVAWVYRHLPLDQLHPYARKTAEASECAAEQGKFWEFGDEIFANQESLSLDYLNTVAQKIGLNMSKFKECTASSKYAAKVQANEQEAGSVGVEGTPGIYVNNVLIKGAVPYENFKEVIDSFLQ